MSSKCIYCLEEKEVAQFNTEHVIQHSMTHGIEGNLTLQEKVCEECNSYFDKELDRPLAHDSIHGLERLANGMRSMNKLTHFKGRDVSIETASDHIDLNNVPVRLVNKEGTIAYAIRAHLNFERVNGEPPLRLYKEELSNVEETFDFADLTGRIKAWAESEEEEKEIWELARQLFNRFGRTLTATGTYIPGTIPVFAEVEFGIRSFRTFAKIAFNYMAKATEHIPTFVFHETFNDARQFIRYGIVPSFRIVEPIGNVGYFDFLGMEQNPKGHFVDLRLFKKGIRHKVASRVTLFNRFGWLVHLCPDYRGLHLDINRMHHWNIEKMICEPFGSGMVTTRIN